MTADDKIPHDVLIGRVGVQLASTSTATDQLLLMRWGVLALCQFLAGGGQGEAEELSVRALDLFIREGVGRTTDAALRDAGSAVARAAKTLGGSVLPQITPAKQHEVRERLKTYEALGSRGVEKADALLSSLRDRLQRAPAGVVLAGTRYRLELVAALVTDSGRPTAERQRAAAAVLYLDELHDALPDTLLHVGLLDDDFALRLVLEETDKYTEAERLHWAERITALWDDLPFLRGVRLQREAGPVATTWLDRINSYVSYSHALIGAKSPLVLVQPSISCSPLHSIVSLIGLLVLEGLTSSRDQMASLERGRVYSIDGQFYARYEGVLGDQPAPGWLRLRFSNGVVSYCPPSMADRMMAVAERPLSSSKAFTAQRLVDDAEPIQKFFDWDEAIGAASLSSRVLLVTSRRRATELLGGIRSNGVSLVDDGLVRFVGMNPSADVVRSGLVLVIPTLAVAQHLLVQGIAAKAIVIDGYERLYRGRHDLPFLQMSESPPSVIAWSATGYCPDEPLGWLPEHRRLQVAPNDLLHMLELDGDLDDDAAPSRASLWEAATTSGAQTVHVPRTAHERAVLDSIEILMGFVRSSGDLPNYWRYQLLSSAATLRTLVAATPACWSDIQELASNWRNVFGEQWGDLRQGAAMRLAPLAQAVYATLAEVARPAPRQNSKGDALLAFLSSSEEDGWCVVCDRADQLRVAGRFLRRRGIQGAEPVLLRDLGVCKACIVTGWRSVFFGRRLAAHTPRRLAALVDEGEAKRWEHLHAQPCSPDGESLLEAVGHVRPANVEAPVPSQADPADDQLGWLDDGQSESLDGSRVPCMFVWFTDEREGRVLARDSPVLVAVGEQAREKPAHCIVAEDRIILGAGAGRWSPAEEFTESVIEVIKISSTELVRDVREWRRALKQLQGDRNWSTEELRDRLAAIGVQRELQTLDGWLHLERASPIGPQYLRKELGAMWPLLDGYTDRAVDDVAHACERLRSARLAAGRALLRLWKGRTVDLGVDEAFLEDLVERLRQEVQVYEVDVVGFGEVPKAMIGWWVTPELAERYERRNQALREPLGEPEQGAQDV